MKTAYVSSWMIIIIAIFIALGCSAKTSAPKIPELKGRINDYAGMISSRENESLTEALKKLEESTSAQVSILTVNSLEGNSVEQFSMAVCEAWKLGQKGKDNGVLILVSKEDRKVRIEVGRGLEDKLTDLVSNNIIQNAIVPNFKVNNYDKGFHDVVVAVSNIITTGKSAFAASPEVKAAPSKKDIKGYKSAIVLVGFVLYFVACFGFTIALTSGATLGALLGFYLFGAALAGGFMGLMAGFACYCLAKSGFFPTFGDSGGGSFSGFSGGGGDFGGGGASGDW